MTFLLVSDNNYGLKCVSSIYVTGEGITKFTHDKSMELQVIPFCETEDCFKTELKYNRSLELIEHVAKNSKNCEQMLKARFLNEKI